MQSSFAEWWTAADRGLDCNLSTAKKEVFSLRTLSAHSAVPDLRLGIPASWLLSADMGLYFRRSLSGIQRSPRRLIHCQYFLTGPENWNLVSSGQGDLIPLLPRFTISTYVNRCTSTGECNHGVGSLARVIGCESIHNLSLSQSVIPYDTHLVSSAGRASEHIRGRIHLPRSSF